MNRVLRRILLAVVVACGLLVSGYLAVAAPREVAHEAAPSPTAAEAQRALEPLVPTPAPPASPGGPAPRLVPVEKEHDFATLFQGDTAEHVFVLRNVGQATAHVTGVKSSCGCTATMLSQDEVPPGGTAEVKATFHAGSFRGRFHKTIRVTSDDPGSPLTLSIQGKVTPLVQVDPELVLFGKVRLGQEVTRRVLLIPARPDVKIDPTRMPGKRGAMQIKSARPLDDGRWVLELAARPENPRHRIPTTMLLPTGLPNSPWATVRLAGQVEGS